ncbi:hypothetical protein SUGI_0730730 [Cryptomeria japonica]|nr:hypothetical protein SUGI_0730730 [Cryptomeria japonica]
MRDKMEGEELLPPLPHVGKSKPETSLRGNKLARREAISLSRVRSRNDIATMRDNRFTTRQKKLSRPKSKSKKYGARGAKWFRAAPKIKDRAKCKS